MTTPSQSAPGKNDNRSLVPRIAFGGVSGAIVGFAVEPIAKLHPGFRILDAFVASLASEVLSVDRVMKQDGSDECCASGQVLCTKCKLVKGSPGCCKIESRTR